MADYQCRHCQDQGDCSRCSWFFEPHKTHAECGHRWGNHSFGRCPAPVVTPSAEGAPSIGDTCCGKCPGGTCYVDHVTGA